MNLKTGYEKLDSIIGSLNEKDLIVIASRLGMGKSILAYNIANSTSREAKGKILFLHWKQVKAI